MIRLRWSCKKIISIDLTQILISLRVSVRLPSFPSRRVVPPQSRHFCSSSGEICHPLTAPTPAAAAEGERRHQPTPPTDCSREHLVPLPGVEVSLPTRAGELLSPVSVRRGHTDEADDVERRHEAPHTHQLGATQQQRRGGRGPTDDPRVCTAGPVECPAGRWVGLGHSALASACLRWMDSLADTRPRAASIPPGQDQPDRTETHAAHAPPSSRVRLRRALHRIDRT